MNDDLMVFGMSVEEFLDKDTLDLLGVKNISEEEKQKIYKKMIDTIQLRVIAKIDDKLETDERREEFKKLIDEANNEKIEAFLSSIGIDIKKLLMEETLIYKTEIVSLAKAEDAAK